jgi:hypothetical protein
MYVTLATKIYTLQRFGFKTVCTYMCVYTSCIYILVHIYNGTYSIFTRKYIYTHAAIIVSCSAEWHFCDNSSTSRISAIRCSHSKPYGNSLVAGLWRHISTVTQRLKETTRGSVFPLRLFRSCLSSGVRDMRFGSSPEEYEGYEFYLVSEKFTFKCKWKFKSVEEVI